MPDCLVQQHTGPAGAEDDGHLAGGGLDGSELQDGSACGFAGVMLGRFVCFSGAAGAFKEVHGDASAAAAAATRGVYAVLRDDEDVQPRERLGVAGEGAVGGCDQDAAKFVVEAGAHLGDP